MKHVEIEYRQAFQKFANFYFVILGFAVSVTVFLSSYFNAPITSMLSYTVEDGHCNQKLEGIGLHCFGDYYYSLAFTEGNPYLVGTQQYPPLAIQMFKVYGTISKILPESTLGLSLYFCTAISFLAFTIFRNFEKKTAITFISIIISSTPFIITFDRGNILLFTIPLVFLFFKAYSRSSRGYAIIFLVLAALIKPQLALYSLIFLRNKRFNEFVRFVLAYFFSNLILFTLFSGNTFSNFMLWVKGLIHYQGLSSEASHFPVNLSAANTFALIWKVFQSARLGDIVDIQLSTMYTSAISLLIFTIFAISFSAKASFFDSIVLITLVLLIFPGTTFSYYLALIYPLMLFYFYQSNVEENGALIGRMSRLKMKIYSFTTLLILVPVGIPLKLLVGLESEIDGSDVSITFIMIGLILAFVFAFISVSSFSGRFKTPIK
jgi:hypothetical protein